VKLINYGMARRGEGEEVIIHRVVQEILRNRTPEKTRKEWITAALGLLNAAAPAESQDVRTWPRWNPLRPHVAVGVQVAQTENIVEPTFRLVGDLANLLYAKGAL